MFGQFLNRVEERRHKMSLQTTLKATSTIKNASNKSGRFVYLASNVVFLSPLVLFVRASRKAKAAAVAEEKDQKAEDEKEIDNGLVLLLRSIFRHYAKTMNFAYQGLSLGPACLQVH